MSDTTQRRKPKEPSSADTPPVSSELQVRVPCEGRTAEEVLFDLHMGLTEAAAAGRDPLIVLEDLGRLEDSVVTLIKGLSRMLVGYPRSVTFWEASGLTEAFLSFMETPDSVKFRKPPEAPAP